MDFDTNDDYEEMLETIDNSIEEIERKIESGRIRSPERDNVRIKYHRALGYMIRSRLKIAESRDLARLGEELESRIEELENESSSSEYRYK